MTYVCVEGGGLSGPPASSNPNPLSSRHNPAAAHPAAAPDLGLPQARQRIPTRAAAARPVAGGLAVPRRPPARAAHRTFLPRTPADGPAPGLGTTARFAAFFASSSIHLRRGKQKDKTASETHLKHELCRTPPLQHLRRPLFPGLTRPRLSPPGNPSSFPLPCAPFALALEPVVLELPPPLAQGHALNLNVRDCYLLPCADGFEERGAG